MDPITATSTGSAAAASAKPNAFSALTSEQFVKIMFSELSSQDPLKPNDSNQLLQQMSNLRNIEADLQLQSKLGTLVSQNQLSSASGMIGAYVSGISEDSRRVEGIVARVSQTKDGPVLTLTSGARVPFSKLDEIADPRDVQLPPNPTPNPNPTPTPQPAPGPQQLESPIDTRRVLAPVAPFVVRAPIDPASRLTPAGTGQSGVGVEAASPN